MNIVLRESAEPFSKSELFERTYDWTAVPRVGEQFEIEPGGWNEEVYRVWWSYDGSVTVELGEHVDTHKEGLRQALLDSGWRIHRPTRN